MNSLGKRILCALLCLASLGLSSCAGGRSTGSYYAENRTYADFKLSEVVKVTYNEVLINMNEPAIGDNSAVQADYPNRMQTTQRVRMRVYGNMNVYDTIGGHTVKERIADGTVVELCALSYSNWMEVYDLSGKFLGYAEDGFSYAIGEKSEIYAELPVEYGQAKTNDDTYVDAYSHLVDISKYFRVYADTSGDYTGVDLSQYDIVVSMQLSTNDTSINRPFYSRNLCMVQYDLLPKIRAAVEAFKADGYTVIIYDAYRPTSVQRRWFEIIREHKWVADPDRGMGGVHDRGTALDMSLLESSTGNLVEMPTPMHTFTEEASRKSTKMTDTARANMDYMLAVMIDAGFSYINSEWWHFQDVNTKYYLPTDHPIDTIPLVVTEGSEKEG